LGGIEGGFKIRSVKQPLNRMDKLADCKPLVSNLLQFGVKVYIVENDSGMKKFHSKFLLNATCYGMNFFATEIKGFTIPWQAYVKAISEKQAIYTGGLSRGLTV
jgi:hypothetical protein